MLQGILQMVSVVQKLSELASLILLDWIGTKLIGVNVFAKPMVLAIPVILFLTAILVFY